MITNQNFQAILDLDLEQIKAKLMDRVSGEGWSRAKAEMVETEYRRFLYLMTAFPDELTTPLEDVDTFWHYHILDTMKYAADCEATFGRFIHHFPYFGMRGEEDAAVHRQSAARMHELYESTFGGSYAGAAQAMASAGHAYCGDTASKAAYCGENVAKAAYCGENVAKAAYCGKYVAEAAYCGKNVAKAAYCGENVAKAAYCGKNVAKAAYCGKNVAKAAYCGENVAKAAYCGKNVAKAAYCGKTGVKAADYCGETAANEAYCGETFGKAFYSAIPERANTARDAINTVLLCG